VDKVRGEQLVTDTENNGDTTKLGTLADHAGGTAGRGFGFLLFGSAFSD
jgi:hypothetical protein